MVDGLTPPEASRHQRECLPRPPRRVESSRGFFFFMRGGWFLLLPNLGLTEAEQRQVNHPRQY